MSSFGGVFFRCCWRFLYSCVFFSLNFFFISSTTIRPMSDKHHFLFVFSTYEITYSRMSFQITFLFLRTTETNHWYTLKQSNRENNHTTTPTVRRKSESRLAISWLAQRYTFPCLFIHDVTFSVFVDCLLYIYILKWFCCHSAKTQRVRSCAWNVHFQCHTSNFLSNKIKYAFFLLFRNENSVVGEYNVKYQTHPF